MPFSRLELLIGKEDLTKLRDAHVLLLGVGGVGSWVAETLARTAIGHITLVDCDTIKPSNINRQVHALHSTLGKLKTDVMAERIRDINPDVEVTPLNIHLTTENIAELLDNTPWSCVIDAIDERKPKFAAILHCIRHGIPILSSMGSANKKPGLAAKIEDGGMGFDYRLAMGLPDYWIKMIKEKSDEQWNPRDIFWEMTNRRADEKTISYAESHDQALVGDKTIIFRLIDADMYWHFKKGDENETARRGIALHKMIRLVVSSTINGGYLNFMGNEWGHPEWIDFPREGNGWSCKYARRQWNLVDNKELCYHWLGDFDRRMLEVMKMEKKFNETPVREIWVNEGDQVMAFMRGDLIYVFNFSPTRSYTDYGFLVPMGSYNVVLNTDSKEFGGNGFADDSITHITNYDELYVKDKKEWLKLYIPARSAVVLKKN